MSLKEFITTIKTDALARSSRYFISFNLPKSLETTLVNNNTELRKAVTLCCETQLPGINISTAQTRTYGEVREMPYEKLFDNVNFTFYVDRKMYIKILFDMWVASIQNPSTRSFNFYNDYITDITITVLDIADSSIYEVTLFECFPKSVSAVQLGYEQKDVMKLNVSINYKHWTSKTIGTGIAIADNGSAIINDLFGFGADNPFQFNLLTDTQNQINNALAPYNRLISDVNRITDFFG